MKLNCSFKLNFGGQRPYPGAAFNRHNLFFRPHPPSKNAGSPHKVAEPGEGKQQRLHAKHCAYNERKATTHSERVLWQIMDSKQMCKIFL